MRWFSFYIIFFFQMVLAGTAMGQKDDDPPVAPVLDMVSVVQPAGEVLISWTLSTSPDVAGYVVYLFKNNEGYALDTLHNPKATSYMRSGTGAAYFSESYVVAALDSSGNISPLSNEINTIHIQPSIDTCNKEITVRWNNYPGSPREVLNYSILCSVDGSGFSEASRVSSHLSSYKISDFETDADYCFIVRANLSGGISSGSNKSCLFTKMQRPPQWINADFATVESDGKISLSFTIDPYSEIKNFSLAKMTGRTDDFHEIHRFAAAAGTVIYTDADADISRVNFYRLTAINSCSNPVKSSNLASNMVLSLERNGENVDLSWNPYIKWKGEIGQYRLYINTRGTLEERIEIMSADTAISIPYSSLMYEVTGSEVCFMIKAIESGNPYGLSGISNSSEACTPVTEIITVPNTFTPDNNGINDYFQPVISFTPSFYRLIITDLQRKTLFESSDPGEKWDGRKHSDLLTEGVYLWFLQVKTPSGKTISKTGTVTIVFNR